MCDNDEPPKKKLKSMNRNICQPGKQMNSLKDGCLLAVKAQLFFSARHACPIVKVENRKLLNIPLVMYIFQLQKVKKKTSYLI